MYIPGSALAAKDRDLIRRAPPRSLLRGPAEPPLRLAWRWSPWRRRNGCRRAPRPAEEARTRTFPARS
ncbi:hypothetical protein QJS66_05105 [Kocuria rhizophila]|nr:hypothetical protein QJS66_05105 [Kocuria rhizophila]